MRQLRRRYRASGIVEVSVGTTVDAAEKQLILKNTRVHRQTTRRARRGDPRHQLKDTLQNKLKEYAGTAA